MPGAPRQALSSHGGGEGDPEHRGKGVAHGVRRVHHGEADGELGAAHDGEGEGGRRAAPHQDGRSQGGQRQHGEGERLRPPGVGDEGGGDPPEPGAGARGGGIVRRHVDRLPPLVGEEAAGAAGRRQQGEEPEERDEGEGAEGRGAPPPAPHRPEGHGEHRQHGEGELRPAADGGRGGGAEGEGGSLTAPIVCRPQRRGGGEGQRDEEDGGGVRHRQRPLHPHRRREVEEEGAGDRHPLGVVALQQAACDPPEGGVERPVADQRGEQAEQDEAGEGVVEGEVDPLAEPHEEGVARRVRAMLQRAEAADGAREEDLVHLPEVARQGEDARRGDRREAGEGRGRGPGARRLAGRLEGWID